MSLNSKPGVKGIDVKVFHDGREVPGNVFLLLGVFENTGGRDVTIDDFIDPIRIDIRDGSSIISADITEPNGVGGRCLLGDGELGVNWRILKPREKLEVAVIVRAESTTTDKLVAVPRLKDVKVGARIKIPESLIRLLLVGVATIIAFTFETFALPSFFSLLYRFHILGPD